VKEEVGGRGFRRIPDRVVEMGENSDDVIDWVLAQCVGVENAIGFVAINVGIAFKICFFVGDS
jgi:hypothetical protein